MQADEAAEMMDKEKESDRFRQRAAVVIAIFAMVLAINNVLASNFFNFVQAKNMRQTALILAADQFELAWLNDPAIPDATKEAMQKKLDQYRRTIMRYESEPETNEGKKELLPRAEAGSLFRLCRGAVANRDRAHLGGDHRQSGLALVLRGGLVGSLLTIDGFFLVVEIPGLSWHPLEAFAPDRKRPARCRPSWIDRARGQKGYL